MKKAEEAMIQRLAAGVAKGSVFDAELKDWRRHMRFTQSMAAQRLRTPLGTYVNWEQGRRRPANIGAIRELMRQSKGRTP